MSARPVATGNPNGEPRRFRRTARRTGGLGHAVLAGCGAFIVAVAALTAVPAQAGVVLAGAPLSVVRAGDSGRMPQPPVVYAFHWANECGAFASLGCTLAQAQLTLDPMLLRLPTARVMTGVGNGAPLMNFVLFHELGHVFDREWMTDAARASFMSAIGRSDGWWSFEDGPPPAELFADAYALCSIYGATIPRDLRHPVGYGWKPTVALDAVTCGIVLSVAGARADAALLATG